MPTRPTVSRRTFTKLLTVLPASACLGREARPPGIRAIDVGSAADYPLSSATRFREHRVIVLRDRGGVMAVSASCTHQGCLLTLDSDALICPCHGSIFTPDGEVISGPATRPLPHYKVTLIEKRLVVDPEQQVPMAERLEL